MPQMNPMNWLFLMIFFLSIYYLVLVKISFLDKDITMSKSSTFSSSAKSFLIKF
uniref:ATP synthase F0 subunit 8 n=1 Tax=Pseudodiaptomus hessei TaxID=2919416 RepID=UPI002A80531E|nr:ATP synthase F0 subunit 8 [Pseudodiaptomus hessei]WOH21599.1 ATP synthase F0 subunit 8 [Pseudodiaptomus hessei]